MGTTLALFSVHFSETMSCYVDLSNFRYVYRVLWHLSIITLRHSFNKRFSVSTVSYSVEWSSRFCGWIGTALNYDSENSMLLSFTCLNLKLNRKQTDQTQTLNEKQTHRELLLRDCHGNQPLGTDTDKMNKYQSEIWGPYGNEFIYLLMTHLTSLSVAQTI
jgi:hypothetical protein